MKYLKYYLNQHTIRKKDPRLWTLVVVLSLIVGKIAMMFPA